MRNVADKLAAESDRSSADYLHEMAADLNAVWLHKHEFEPTFKSEIAADPWLDEDAEQSDLPQVSKPDDLENIPEEQAEASVMPATQVKRESQLVRQLLKAMPQSLRDRPPCGLDAQRRASFAIANSLNQL